MERLHLRDVLQVRDVMCPTSGSQNYDWSTGSQYLKARMVTILHLQCDFNQSLNSLFCQIFMTLPFMVLQDIMISYKEGYLGINICWILLHSLKFHNCVYATAGGLLAQCVPH